MGKRGPKPGFKRKRKMQAPSIVPLDAVKVNVIEPKLSIRRACSVAELSEGDMFAWGPDSYVIVKHIVDKDGGILGTRVRRRILVPSWGEEENFNSSAEVLTRVPA